jgi:sterol desaturase/sphingolipid hydroxylase (fatty acid hydroxylase superfamily)
MPLFAACAASARTLALPRMSKVITFAVWAVTALLVSELLGYLLHRLLHSGWIPFLSMNHMRHHLLLYGPLQKQRPSPEYLDATIGRFAIGNVGLEWIVPAAILLITLGGLFWLFGIRLEYQALFFGVVLAWSVWSFSYLHDRMHIQDFWMERFPIVKHWFRRARNLHDIHHRVLNAQGFMDKNFGIGFAFFDWLFGTMASVQPPFNHAGIEAAEQRFAFVTQAQSQPGKRVRKRIEKNRYREHIAP